jgi:tetratricopeptide (TPR) repeat protein
MLCAVVCASTMNLNAQGAKVLNAYNYMNDNELLKARAEIDPAIENEKTMLDAKTWYYRGLIYEKIYKNSFAENEKTQQPLYPKLKPLRSESVQKAIDSYEKAISLDSKKINMSEVKQHHAEMSKWAYQEGVNFYNQKDYGNAGDLFAKSFEIRKTYGATDTMAGYNAGLAYKLGKDIPNAEKYLNNAIAMNYNVEQVYLDLLHMYSENKDAEKFKSTLSEARTKLPNNKEILQEEINVYIEAKEYDKALKNLNKAIELDPSNKALIYARGIILDNKQGSLKEEGKKDEAELAYTKAEADYIKVVELDPNGFDGNYSIGALYYNHGAEMLNEANNLLDDEKYKVAKAEAEKQLKAALPYLEKAHELDPTDRTTMESLKVIYVRTNQMEKFNAIKEKLEN